MYFLKTCTSMTSTQISLHVSSCMFPANLLGIPNLTKAVINDVVLQCILQLTLDL